MSVPKLRFKRDDGNEFPNWNSLKLSDFTERVTRKNKNGETDIPLTISSLDGLVDQNDYFNKTVASKNLSGYFLLKNGEFAYNKSYSNGFDYGSIKRLDKYDKGAISTLYICFALNDGGLVDSDFLTFYFDSNKWNAEAKLICAEGARNHGLLNVSANDFFDMNLFLPTSIEEQQKIADFFSTLDNIIDKTQAELAAWEKQKQGIMQKLFSQEIRFKADERDEYSQWEEKALGEIFAERSERSKGNEELLSVTIANGIMKQSKSEKRNVASEDTSNYKVVYPGDLAYNTMRMWQGAEGASDYYGMISPAYTVLICNADNDVNFFAKMFKRKSMLHQFEKHSQGLTSDTWNLKYNHFAEIKVMVPCLEEQRKIADCLSAFDSVIDKTKQELEAYKLLKKGLMQQMFA